MDTDFRFFPEQASANAAGVDALYAFLLGVTIVFTVLIFTLIGVFCIRYRRRPGHVVGQSVKTNIPLEVTGIVVPFVLVMIMFFWGAAAYFPISRAPSDALDVYVVGKQWMWKLQHAEGPSEINELHLPAGRSIRLLMTSQDVIHSFYVPAFRLKQDVLPGRYTTMTFQTTRPGEYALYCAEYCGTKHSGMGGRVVVLTASEYQRWLSGEHSQSGVAARGRQLYLSLGCAPCHDGDSGPRGPDLHGLSGRRVLLQDGREVVADESYLRESIVDPATKLVSGYQPIMPVYRGRVSEEELHLLVAYLKSLDVGPERTVER